MIQERSFSRAIFLERPSFQNIWKKKIWFFVQCFSTVNKILILGERPNFTFNFLKAPCHANPGSERKLLNHLYIYI